LKVLRCLFHTDRDEGWKRYAAELSRRSLERGRRSPLHEARFHVRMAGLASEAGMEKEGLLRMAAAARLFEEALSDGDPVDIDDPSFVLDDLLPLITTMGAIVPADEDMKRAAADGAASLRTIIMELRERELRRMTG